MVSIALYIPRQKPFTSMYELDVVVSFRENAKDAIKMNTNRVFDLMAVLRYKFSRNPPNISL